VPVTTRQMDKNTLLRKSMRILRLLEVSETRGASGVAWNAGERRCGIHLVKRSAALRDFVSVHARC
jgi:hypothetical protein